ncbi:MAG: carbohydrate ABC transporter permease [Cyanobacteria bacterium Co-bin13]|nr:carbohydrate ABC transporter permease [Cyanobacteria bacterium Co-bin13]
MSSTLRSHPSPPPSLAFGPEQLWRIFNGLLLAVGALVVLWPLGVVVATSLQPSGTAMGADVATGLTFENYRQAWSQGNFLLAFANSALVALSVTALQIATSALAGYALARLKFRGRQAVLLIVLATLIIPFQLLVIPIFLVLKWGHLINTYGALILPTAANGYGIFLMRQYFLTIPLELEEAAALDGASRWQILWEVMLPLARPALVTLFLFTFIGEWNDLFKPLIFTTRPELQTVQLALASFQEQFTSDWPLLMAAVVIATVPVVLLFLIGQRQFIRGIAATGIKS